ncbi:MAG: hypothetical protein AB8B94_07430 [Hyphomicrobiales bacterium]
MGPKVKTILQKAVLFVACLAFSLFGVQAQEVPLRATERLALSGKLYLHGLYEQDALSLISAATLRKEVFFKDEVIGENKGKLSKGKAPISWQEMLDVASVFAASREDLRALIADVQSQISRGVLTGALISKGEIAPFAKQEYLDIRFEGGVFAEVYSEGRSAENIDMFVYDERGRLVCAQTDPSPISLCGWTPSSTSNHKVVLENKSGLQVYYAFFTN